MEKIEIKKNAFVKFCVDFLPLIGFLITYYSFGIIPGTITLMILCFFAVIMSVIIEKKIPYMPIITALIVLLFGGLTVYFNDERFIKMKPTVINFILGAAIYIALMFKKYPLKILLGKSIKLQDKGWEILSKRWAIFFIILGILNEIVWRNTSTAIWVNFKVFGLLIITVIFAMLQSKLIQKYQINTNK